MAIRFERGVHPEQEISAMGRMVVVPTQGTREMTAEEMQIRLAATNREQEMSQYERERVGDMAKNEEAYEINLGPYGGMRFVYISENLPEYCGAVRSFGLLTTNRVYEEGTSLVEFRRYHSHRDLKSATPEDEGGLGLGDNAN